MGWMLIGCWPGAIEQQSVAVTAVLLFTIYYVLEAD